MKFVRLIALILLVVVATHVATSEAQSSRPEGVPKDAFWVGGPDGGVFATIKSGENPRQFRAKIYGDETGDLLFSGLLYLDRLNPPIARPGDPAIYSGWDGEGMLLTDGRKLRARSHHVRSGKGG